MDDTIGPIAVLQPLLLAIIQKLVDHPETVALESQAAGVEVIFKLYVERTDLGDLKGKQGSHVRALRHLLTAFGRKYSQRLKLKVYPIISET